MNALVKKEIRLLLPSFLLGLALAFSVWLIPPKSVTGLREGLAGLPFLCCPAVLVMMMLASFGQEFSTGTFSLLLSQPIPRLRIWWTKTLLLGVAALLIWLVWCVCYWLHNPGNLAPKELLQIFAGFAIYVLVGYSGGLWTVLLFRQVAAAFWFTVLIPAMVVVTLGNLLENYPANVQFSVPAGVLALYGIAGFLLARRLFLRAQDTAWTGGIIDFSRWRYFERGAQSSVSLRRRRPIAALLKKEFQLHSISLLSACALLALHLGVFFLRAFYSNYHRSSVAGIASDFFWTLWLVMPVIIGCSAVAEERKLGVAEAQLCLPASRRIQFAAKFIPTLIFGTLLGGFMPLLLESIAAYFGVPNEIFTAKAHDSGLLGNGLFWFRVCVIALSAGLAWAGFYASTLTRNFLHALAAAITTVLGCILFGAAIGYVMAQRMTFFGIMPWHSILPFLLAIPTIPAALLWLAWLNFNHYLESRRLWQRNVLVLAGTVIFIVAGSTAIYNRVWEVFEPAEPPHGPAKFSSSALPKLQNGNHDNFLIQLPDGRIWCDSLGYSYFNGQMNDWDWFCYGVFPPLPASAGPQQFIAGSNWVSATTSHIEFWYPVGVGPSKAAYVVGYLDTVGIRRDGTLWISAESKPGVWTGAQMVRFGDETNWQQAGWAQDGLLLLKNDGTLWRWGTNHFEWSQWRTNWPTVRIYNPRQIGTNSDWSEIIPNLWWIGCARKADGSVWTVGEDYKTGRDELKHATNLDQIVSQTSSFEGNGSGAYVGKNGTLWAHISHWENGLETRRGFQQIGKGSNWVSVAVSQHWLVALKADGSLWKWDFWDFPQSEVVRTQPTRLGIHNDWVALNNTWGGIVSLASDGSLWLWPAANYNELALLKSPKQPQFLGNVFGKSN